MIGGSNAIENDTGNLDLRTEACEAEYRSSNGVNDMFQADLALYKELLGIK